MTRQEMHNALIAAAAAHAPEVLADAESELLQDCNDFDPEAEASFGDNIFSRREYWREVKRSLDLRAAVVAAALARRQP